MDMSTYEIISLIINTLIMVAGFSAIIIYKVQKRDKIKTAATNIISPLKFHHLPRGVIGCY